MTDPVNVAIFITISAAVIGMFFRIEHRLTKVETTLAFIKDNLNGCRQTSEGHTK